MIKNGGLLVLCIRTVVFLSSLIIIIFKNVGMNCQVYGCVCPLLLLYGRLSSCCELLWDMQLTQSL